MRVFNFPTCPVKSQLFHVPGAANEGGYTSGAVRLLSPEPGGRSVLELQIAFQVREWDYPISSWIMSKGNGEIFRVRLAPTPQVLSVRGADVLWQPDTLWSGDVPWDGDITVRYAAAALEGTTIVQIDMTGYSAVVRPGHVVGHAYDCYFVDEVEYNGAIATLTIKPPLRRDVAVGDSAPFRPWFTGTIGNIGDVRATYDAENVGHIQPGKIVFAESIL